MYSYAVGGLSVASEIALPGANPIDAPTSRPDVVIARGDVPVALENASASGPTWQLAEDKFLLRIPNVARFLLTGGHAVTFELDSENSPDDVAIFLIGTVFGILLHQRKQIVLHASAVRVGGKAVLFCGPSGAGKSTLAAALDRLGYHAVTDDFCAVKFDGSSRPHVQSDGRQLKLWAHAIAALDLTENRGAPVRRQLEKFYVEPANANREPLPLGTIYVLREARPPHKPGIERPSVVDAALLLRRNAYRPLLVRRMGQKVDYFNAAAKMANTAGIFHLTRVLDFAKMPAVISGLREHWAEIGLLEAATA